MFMTAVSWLQQRTRKIMLIYSKILDLHLFWSVPYQDIDVRSFCLGSHELKHRDWGGGLGFHVTHNRLCPFQSGLLPRRKVTLTPRSLLIWFPCTNLACRQMDVVRLEKLRLFDPVTYSLCHISSQKVSLTTCATLTEFTLKGPINWIPDSNRQLLADELKH